MSNSNTSNGNNNKQFSTVIQNNMKVTGTTNPEIIQGIKNGNIDYYTDISSNDYLNIDLEDEYFIKSIKLCFWHFDDRYYTYDCFVSKDKENWKEIFTGYNAKCNDTIIIMDSIRYIRLRGKNNINERLHLINFKIN